MFDDLPSLFYNNVVLAYDRYVSIRDGTTWGHDRHTRSALDAATALFHFREHLPQEYKKQRAQVVAECADYRLVADVANAAKHRTLTNRTSEGEPLVKSAEDVEEITIVTCYEDEDGEYTDATTRIFVNCSDGTKRSLDIALTNVLNYWGSELKRLGIISSYAERNAAEQPGSRFFSRSEARSQTKEIVQGLRMKQSVQLLRFDASKGCAVPIDLTGAKLEYKIYKPGYSIAIQVKSPSLEEPIKCAIELTEEQSLTVAGLKTKAERTSYINAIIGERREEIQGAISTTLKARTEALPASGDPLGDAEK